MPWLALLLAALLGGCAATQLDASVNTVGTWPGARPAGTYAFERLPSQQARVDEQDKLEAAARPALAQAGFKPAEDAPADVLVQVAERSLQSMVGVYPDPFFSPYWAANAFYAPRWGWGPGWGWGWGGGNVVPYYLVEVSVLILDARSKQALYESRAQSSGALPDANTRGALFSAAMKDFPYAAVSPRRVTVELPK